MLRKGIFFGAVLVLAAMPAWATPLPLVPGTSFVPGDKPDDWDVGDWDSEEGAFWYGEFTNPNSGSELRAAARFWVTGDVLNVTLRNISEDPVEANSDLLHGVFFSAAGRTFTVDPDDPETGSATATDGLLGVDGDRDNILGEGANVGRAFGYQEDLDLSWVVNGGEADRGIAGVPYDFGPVEPPHPSDFGNAEVFDETGEGNFPPPRRPLRYGIVPGLLDDDDNPIGDTRQNVPNPLLPVVYRQVDFQLTGADGFDFQDIDNVRFAYGTDLEIIPEPATMTLLGLGLAGLGVRRMRRGRAAT